MVSVEYLISMLNMERAKAWPCSTAVDVIKGRTTLRARNLLAERALASGADAVLYIDSDQYWETAFPAKLIKHKKDIVAAWARSRYPGECGQRFINVFKEQDPEDGLWRVLEKPTSDGLEEVKVVGFGMTLVQTKVFRRMKKPWFRHDVNAQEDVDGEDVSFCNAARAAGCRVFVDWSLPLGHTASGVSTKGNKYVGV
jgi:hypothetical protein